MTDSPNVPPEARASGPDPVADLPTHPKGTLAIVLIYGLLFFLGWAWVYFGEFLSRGAPTG